MSKSRIAIIGTGLIGTSIGLKLMSRKERSYDVVGADRDRGHAHTAKKMGALDREVGSLQEAAEGAGLIILAAPVMGCRQVLQDIAPYLVPGAIVTDTCSTKADIMRWAAEFLPENVHFVGGHPMAGREVSGPAAASADLFKDATWAVTPTPRAGEGAVSVILDLVEFLGAHPLFVDPAEHDQYAAAVSHVPILISVALFRMLRDSQGWEDASLLAGPAFRDLTRLASGDPTMSRDIVTTNRDAILHWLQRYKTELNTITAAIEQDVDAVTDLFKSTQLDRDVFIENPPVARKIEGVAGPSSQDALGHMFGGALYDKFKDMSTRVPTSKDDPKLRRKLGMPDDR
jgi:prephenate dehydrogenase